MVVCIQHLKLTAPVVTKINNLIWNENNSTFPKKWIPQSNNDNYTFYMILFPNYFPLQIHETGIFTNDLPKKNHPFMAGKYTIPMDPMGICCPNCRHLRLPGLHGETARPMAWTLFPGLPSVERHGCPQWSHVKPIYAGKYTSPMDAMGYIWVYSKDVLRVIWVICF